MRRTIILAGLVSLGILAVLICGYILLGYVHTRAPGSEPLFSENGVVWYQVSVEGLPASQSLTLGTLNRCGELEDREGFIESPSGEWFKVVWVYSSSRIQLLDDLKELASLKLAPGETAHLILREGFWWILINISVPSDPIFNELCVKEAETPEAIDRFFEFTKVGEEIGNLTIPGYDQKVSVTWDGKFLLVNNEEGLVDFPLFSCEGPVFLAVSVGDSPKFIWRIQADKNAFVNSAKQYKNLSLYLDNCSEVLQAVLRGSSGVTKEILDKSSPMVVDYRLARYGVPLIVSWTGTSLLVQGEDRKIITSLRALPSESFGNVDEQEVLLTVGRGDEILTFLFRRKTY